MRSQRKPRFWRKADLDDRRPLWMDAHGLCQSRITRSTHMWTKSPRSTVRLRRFPDSAGLGKAIMTIIERLACVSVIVMLGRMAFDPIAPFLKTDKVGGLSRAEASPRGRLPVLCSNDFLFACSAETAALEEKSLLKSSWPTSRSLSGGGRSTVNDSPETHDRQRRGRVHPQSICQHHIPRHRPQPRSDLVCSKNQTECRHRR